MDKALPPPLSTKASEKSELTSRKLYSMGRENSAGNMEKGELVDWREKGRPFPIPYPHARS